MKMVRVTHDVFDALLHRYGNATRLPAPTDRLGGFPVVIDETIPVGVWRLVDSETGAVLCEGTVEDLP